MLDWQPVWRQKSTTVVVDFRGASEVSACEPRSPRSWIAHPFTRRSVGRGNVGVAKTDEAGMWAHVRIAFGGVLSASPPEI